MIEAVARRGPVLPVLAALLMAAPAPASDRPTLVVWLDPAPPDPTVAVRRELDTRSFDLATATWTGPGMTLHFADPRTPRPDVELFKTLSAVRDIPGVIAAGELLIDGGDRVRFSSGRVVLRFRMPTTEAEARAAGDALGLGPLERADRRGEVYLFDVELRPSELSRLRSNASLLPSIEYLRPLDFVARDPSRLRPLASGRYHRIPEDRNVLTLLLRSDVIHDDVKAVINAHGGQIEDRGTADRWIKVKFEADPPKSDEEEMDEALADLLQLEQHVLHAGPAVLGGPHGFLTDQLVVRFASEIDRYMAAPILDTSSGGKPGGFEEIRRLPYLENGYLFRYRSPSYRIYDAARELILQGRAVYAVPNLMTVNVSAAGACADDCFSASHQGYLNTMHVCEPRTAMPTQSADWNVRLAVLDEGATGLEGDIPAVCERLYVETVVDFESMQVCSPSDATDWCSECNGLVGTWGRGHGNGVSLIAAATRAGEDQDLVGVAPGVKLINARRPTNDEGLMTDVAFSDALWWLAGGDPEWCCDVSNYPCSIPDPCSDPCAEPAGEEPACLPARLSSEQRADVINLSFTREDFLGKLDGCSANEGLCTIVCENPSACAVIQETLEKIRCEDCGRGMRPGGTVVVAAVGNHLNECVVDRPNCYPPAKNPAPSCFRTDLAELETTVAVGSVELTADGWRPYYKTGEEYCLIHNEGSFVDAVGPFGYASGAVLCYSCGSAGGIMTFGLSSGATAAVSGIAATMLQLNPNLTAEQVHCILRETAEPDFWPETSGWPFPGCDFVSVDGKLHSPCMGRGMTDSCKAAAAAVACGVAESLDCPRRCAVEVRTPAECVETDDEDDEEEEEAEVCEKDDEKTKPVRSVKIGKVTYVMEPKELPPVLLDLLRCLVEGRCYCETRPHCLHLGLVNPQRRTLRNRQVQLCFDERCWTMPGTIGTWKPGQEIQVPLQPQPAMLGYLRLGLPATIKIVRESKGGPKKGP